MAKGKVLGFGVIEGIRIRVSKEIRIMIGRAEEQLDVCTVWDVYIGDGQRFAGIAIDELYGAAEAQELFDSSRNCFGMRREVGEMLGLLQECGQAVADEVDRGFVAGNQEQHGSTHQLGRRQLVVAEACPHELAQQIIGLGGASSTDMTAHVGAEPENVGIEIRSAARYDA